MISIPTSIDGISDHDFHDFGQLAIAEFKCIKVGIFGLLPGANGPVDQVADILVD